MKKYLLYTILFTLSNILFAQQAEFYFNNNTIENISGDTAVPSNNNYAFITDRHQNPSSALHLKAGNWFSYGDATYARLGSGDFSFSFWMKKSVWPGGVMFVKNLNYTRYYSFTYTALTSSIDFKVHSNLTDYTVGASSITDTTWMHIVITAKRNDSLKIYVNNVFRAKTSITGLGNDTLDIPGADFTFSRINPGASGDLFIDDFKIFKKELNLQEINTLYTELPSSIDNNNTEIKLAIYPNPNTGIFVIETNTTSQIKIYDVLGKTVFSKAQASMKEIVDLTNQNNGVYFVELSNGKEMITKKIILAR